MKAEIWRLEGGEDVLAGVLRLEGGKVVAAPATPACATLVQNILADDIPEPLTGRRLSAKGTPEEWLRNLPAQYHSAYLRAKLVEEPGDG